MEWASLFDSKNDKWTTTLMLAHDHANAKAANAYDGAAALNPLTMPQYPPLQKYFDGVSDLLVGDRDTALYAPDKAAATFTEKGYAKNSDGMWEKDGEMINCEIVGFGPWVDLGPISCRAIS